MSTEWILKKVSGFRRFPGPVVLAVMDGVGLGRGDESDAVAAARTPNLSGLRRDGLHVAALAHGKAVGMPSDADMGNSEVGHNAMGAGRIFAQGASLVNQAIEDGTLFSGETWRWLTRPCVEEKGTLHFIGLLSDGNVHSHQAHLEALLEQAAREGVRSVRVHILLDGRDVPETSAHLYVEKLERTLRSINEATGFDYRIASGGGRMTITMDRYGADWAMVARGWDIHVHGKGRRFSSAMEALRILRQEAEGVIDQYLPGFVIARDGKPVGPIRDGDSVVFFNFRGDRAIELTQAFEEDDFTHFDRSPRPKVRFAGMMQYDGDLKLPSHYLVSPPAIDRTISEYLVHNGVRQYAISETQKFGHVTYFWNGNRSGKFDASLETYCEIPSDPFPFEERPWMKAADITDHVIRAAGAGRYDFIRLNYANGDMVGHTGDFEATVLAVEAVDLCLGRLRKAVDETGGVLVVTADHGNADEMILRDKNGRLERDEQGHYKARTSHSLNKVPFIIYSPQRHGFMARTDLEGVGLANYAATIMNLLGFYAPDDYEPSLITFDNNA